MKGYLMQEKLFVRGEDTFIESYSPENHFGVVFEDDGQTGYFYAVETDTGSKGQRVLDALHIYEVDESVAEKKSSELKMIWSTDWMKSALVIDGQCHAVFDFSGHAGYNINEFPPPNSFWSTNDRKLSSILIQEFF